MAKSVPISETISLGKKIVTEFLTDDRDITARWIAHYLAEVITSAERSSNKKKRAALQKECVELILKLWEKRSTFPNHATPLANLSNVLAVLEALDGKDSSLPWRKYMLEDDGNPWGKFIQDVRTSFEQVLQIALLMTAVPSLLKKESEWLAHETYLSDKEKQTIGLLDRVLRNATRQLTFPTIDFAGRTDSGRRPKIDQTFDGIKHIFESQIKSLDKLRKIVEPPTAKKLGRKTDKSK